MGESRSPHGLIIGSGPSGLAAAVCLRSRGVASRLVDRRGEPGGAFRELHRGVTLHSPARYTDLPLLPLNHPREYVTVPEYRNYLLRYAEHFGLSPERAQERRFAVLGALPGRNASNQGTVSPLTPAPLPRRAGGEGYTKGDPSGLCVISPPDRRPVVECAS